MSDADNKNILVLCQSGTCEVKNGNDIQKFSDVRYISGLLDICSRNQGDVKDNSNFSCMISNRDFNSFKMDNQIGEFASMAKSIPKGKRN